MPTIDFTRQPDEVLLRHEFLRPGPDTMDRTPWDAMVADRHAPAPAVRKGRLTARKWAGPASGGFWPARRLTKGARTAAPGRLRCRRSGRRPRCPKRTKWRTFQATCFKRISGNWPSYKQVIDHTTGHSGGHPEPTEACPASSDRPLRPVHLPGRPGPAGTGIAADVRSGCASALLRLAAIKLRQGSACQTLYRDKTDKTKQRDLRRLREQDWLRVGVGGMVWPGVIAGPDDGVI